ncbi:MAG TPA: TylF/MycF/NovP-related O-methyltransferase [Candidatus Angelobacter sp.]|nr:TylF/MycF/NovP-related O-methyltransferase [Candidatus Angelobacter sp.]
MLRGLYHLAFNPRARREWRWMFLTAITKRLMPGYRLQWPQTLWWSDKQFNSYLARFHELDGYNSDRRWLISQLVKLAANVPGDTAECGVLEGSSSYLIAKAFPNRTHHAFDSFEGCSAPSGTDNGYFSTGDLAVTLEQAAKNLADCPNVVFHKGWIPERFADVSETRFAFVHIDVQLEQPTGDSLQFFYPRMNHHGIMVFDDYGFTTCPGARRVIDEIMKDKPEPIIALPNGCAFIVRNGSQT